jgi:hypothetical protein
MFYCQSEHRPLRPGRPPKWAVMADQIVITEKTSQAKDVRAAIGSRYGDVLPAEGHLFDLLEPEDVDPAWKRWSPILLRPEGLYGTRPAEGGNKAAKLKAIREALRLAKRVWLATDSDREGQLIGQEILEQYEYRGQVMRVLFTAQFKRDNSPICKGPLMDALNLKANTTKTRSTGAARLISILSVGAPVVFKDDGQPNSAHRGLANEGRTWPIIRQSFQSTIPQPW